MKKITSILYLCLLTATLQAQVRNVPQDYNTIQEAITASNPGDTVLVSDGTYYEQINFLGKKPLIVASEYLTTGDASHIESTIIDGSQIVGDSCSVVYFINGEDSTSVLYGLTIQGGHGTLWEYGRSGGGICCFSGASILNNIIQNNQIVATSGGAHGGGILVDSDSPVHIENNTIRNNLVDCQSTGQNAAAGGAILAAYSSGCRFTISGNLIEGNEARTSSSYLALGGGIHFEVVSALCENNIFKNNVCLNTVTNGANGGAMHWYMYLDGSCVRGNSFIQNTSEHYGGALSVETPDSLELLIENNFFEGNSSNTGGALCTWNCKLLIQNNVFNSNHSSNLGGACFLEYDVLPLKQSSILINNSFYNNSSIYGGSIASLRTKPLILNSIFWKDTANMGQEIYLSGGDSVEVAYTDIDMSRINGGTITDGGGNIPGSDPLFMSPDYLMLSGVSPCIDKGTGLYECISGVKYKCPDYDILYTGRPVDDAFDLGAYEWYLGVGVPGYDNDHMIADIYPNPTQGYFSCRFSIACCQRVTLKIFDIQGREVATVFEDNLPAGEHILLYDGWRLPAGVYFYQLTIDNRQLAGGKIMKL